jgi:deoxyribodipyrimidine photo-lyase
MTTTMPTLVWLRNDLRLADNPALSAAAASGPIAPIYILDETSTARRPGAASLWWLDKSLRSLAADLATRGVDLILRRGDPLTILQDTADEIGARGVCWNRLYDAPSIARDARIKAALRDRGLEARSFNGSLLNEPWTIATGAGAPYRVFTPYWKAARAILEARPPSTDPASGGVIPVIEGPSRSAQAESLDDWRLHPREPDWSAGFADWRPGEAGAQARLTAFLDDAASGYPGARDRPGAPGTSRLSPHLHFGEISPHRVWAASKAAAVRGAAGEAEIDAFLRELGWREFNHHLLYHFPDMPRSGFNPRFDAFPWLDDPAGLKAWRRGRTGYPIVDAGMRELWTTGWMHNRVRMIVASFLVKDLLIDWRVGEAWFWDTLVDADLANNVAGWQWVAGSGADAAPYFRVFNPVLQGEKFDPDGEYVRRWAPELARLPNACIHCPWQAEPQLMGAAGMSQGVTYPAPIVDHAEARDRALAAYERLR